MELDLLIENGTVVDGTGTARMEGCQVGVRDGRIAYLGLDRLPARRRIDATGRIVCPGFLDIHTHYDAQILWDRMLSISPWHGVTTVIMGNCGFGIAPTRPQHRDLMVQTLERVEGMNANALRAGLGEWGFETFSEYLDLLEARGSCINVAAMLGHTPLRTYVMGRDAVERTATAAEVVQMRQVARVAFEAGAIGFSSSRVENHLGFEGKPVPSRLAGLGELEALVEEMVGAGVGVLQMTTGPDLFFREYAGLARRHGVTITWAALLADRTRYGLTPQDQLRETRRLVEEGLRVHPQVSARPVNFEMTMEEPFILEQLPDFNALVRGSHADRVQAYRTLAFRAMFRKVIDEPIDLHTGLIDTFVAVCDTEPALQERRVVDIARERGTHPADLILDLALATDLQARFRIPMSNRDDALVGQLLRDPYTVLGLSDAGAHASQLCDACMTTSFLQKWVREKCCVGLEAAIRMMTGWPADLYGIRDRGLLRPGMAADIVVFDMDTVAAGPLERVHDMPGGADRMVSRAHGIDHVIVNGQPIRAHGADVVGDALPGALLRHGRAATRPHAPVPPIHHAAA